LYVYGEGGAQTSAFLSLNPMVGVVVGLFRDLFVTFIKFEVLCTNINDFSRSVNVFAKKSMQ
jgi:hypothetical protein